MADDVYCGMNLLKKNPHISGQVQFKLYYYGAFQRADPQQVGWSESGGGQRHGVGALGHLSVFTLLHRKS